MRPHYKEKHQIGGKENNVLIRGCFDKAKPDALGVSPSAAVIHQTHCDGTKAITAIRSRKMPVVILL